SATDVTCFLPVEIVDRPGNDDTPPATAPAPGMIEIDIAGGHRDPFVQRRHSDTQIIRHLFPRKPTGQCNAHRILAELVRSSMSHSYTPLLQ
ncbi:MAG: hypothetical protein ACJA1L_000677, partial [Paracoccaceae bacterium]